MEIDVNLTINAPELADALNNIAQAIESTTSLPEDKPKQTRTRHSKKAEDVKPEVPAPAPIEAPKTESKPAPAPKAEPAKSKEDISKLRDKLKAVAIEKARAGKNEDIKAAIKAADSENLSGIPADKVSEVLEKISAL